MIRVQNLTFDYPGKRALEDVSFHIPAGSVTALVGPNGAGKTTLLRAIAGLDAPMAGQVEVDGIDVLVKPREAHRHMGYLSDFFGLYDDLSVRRCLAYTAAVRGGASEAVEPAAERLGLSEYLDAPARELSRGLRQRLAIAQAIIHRPRVLLLDEPASGLDPEARISLGKLFLELRDGGMTLVVSSHILAELEQYASDILILRQGRVLDHRNVHEAQPRRRIRLDLAEPAEDLAGVLASMPELEEIEVSANTATFRFAGDSHDRHALLQRLISQGLSVCGFAEVHASLQEAYLEHIQVGGGRR